MAQSTIARPLLAAMLFGVVGCSLFVDVSDIDPGCGAGRKLCGAGHCVEQDDPAYGCTVDHCEPCSLANAIPACEGETCAVKACLFGFGCANEAGCPAHILIERSNCGACGVSCVEGESCRDGRCVRGE
ncbi:MAG: hypothetical protein ABW061_15580 [Polyangiaceae bacterium]